MLTECGNVPTPELLEQTRAELGLDKPFLIQYGTWLKGVLTGDMGTSYSMKVPVVEKLTSCFWPTLKLALFSPDHHAGCVHSTGDSVGCIPEPMAGLPGAGADLYGSLNPKLLGRFDSAQYFRCYAPDGLPYRGSTDFKSLILPAVTLAFSMSAKYTRQVRIAVLEELRQDYVTGARMRGIRESTILWKHVLPNSMLPLVTLLGISLGSLLGGTAVVEIIYNWPGLGSMAVKAISCRDYPLVQGYVLWIALLYMGINLLVDLSYNRLDPRLKEER